MLKETVQQWHESGQLDEQLLEWETVLAEHSRLTREEIAICIDVLLHPLASMLEGELRQEPTLPEFQQKIVEYCTEDRTFFLEKCMETAYYHGRVDEMIEDLRRKWANEEWQEEQES